MPNLIRKNMLHEIGRRKDRVYPSDFPNVKKNSHYVKNSLCLMF